MKKMILAFAAALLLSLPCFAVKPPKGFDAKVYSASFALYATSELAGHLDPKFTCTATAFQELQNGYLLLSAGHCTPAGEGMPPDMKFFVEQDIDSKPYPVKLLKAIESKPFDYAIFYLPKLWVSEHNDGNYSLDVPVIPLGSDDALTIGDRTVDVNFSLGLGKQVSPGIVASIVEKSGPAAGFYLVDQFDSHGASGSAIVDERTKQIVGIVIAGVDGTTTPTWVEPVAVVQNALLKMDIAALIEKPDVPVHTNIVVRFRWLFGEWTPMKEQLTVLLLQLLFAMLAGILVCRPLVRRAVAVAFAKRK